MKAGTRFFLMLFAVCLTYQAFCQEASVSVKITPPEFGVFTMPGTSTQSGTITSTAISSPTHSLPYYYLLTGAALGSAAPGSRKLYKDGNVLTTPIPVIIAASPIAGKDTEIGNLNQPGSVVLSGSMTDTAPSNLNFYVQVTVPADIADGVYTNAFTFSLYLYSASAGSGTLTAPSKGSLTFSVNVTIAQGSVSLSLNPTSISFNKGNPVTPLTPLADLKEKAAVNITATRGYTLTVSSSHSGLLWLSDKDTIPYILKVEGVIIDLSSGKEVLIAESASAGVASYTLELAILALGDKKPGNYSDILTFIATVR